MPSLLRMPEVAADTPEATLLAWPIAENSVYSANDALFTVETAKAVVDVEADADGVILKTLVAEGAEVKVGEPIAVIGAPGETIDNLDSVLAALGLVSKSSAESSGETTDETPAVSAASLNGASGPSDNARLFASPLARRLARDAGLTLAEITGTGPNNRIVRRDVEQAKSRRSAASPDSVSSPATSGPAAPNAPVSDALTSAGQTPTRAASAPLPSGATFTDEAHSRLRKAIASRLTQSKQTAPHFYLRGQAKVDRLLKLRAELNAGSASRISVNDLVVKAVARAHVLVPAMNVIWTPEAIRRFSSVDVAVAVATANGLVTPVVREVQDRSVGAVAATTRDYAERARAGRLQQHELEGGSITVSNLGMYGTSEFAAIINPSQASILAVGAAVEEPIVRNGKLKVGTLMRVTLSVDHRPVDGATAAEWMRAFVDLIENPLTLLI
jgi:pyruvate dehydrogenase E2 component (dihydrolipoamide acetyltransferase)